MHVNEVRYKENSNPNQLINEFIEENMGSARKKKRGRTAGHRYNTL